MMQTKLSLGVVFGGRSGEHEVSLMSARSILQAVDREVYEVTEIGITHEGSWVVGEHVLEKMTQGEQDQLSTGTILPDPALKGLFRVKDEGGRKIIDLLRQLDVVFPVLHGTFGEDGTIQGLFELVDLAYVGAGVLGSALGMDKGVFKDVMRAQGIPVVDSIVMTRREIENDIESCLDRAMEISSFPLFVKPANLGSSVGISKCNSRSDLVEALHDAAAYDRRVLVERGVAAREIEVSVLGNEDPIASLPGEIIPSREFYSYEAKYVDEASELIIPAVLPGNLVEKVQKLAVKAYKAIDCSGMARVDFLLEKTNSEGTQIGELYLNELNTIPGFTKISMYPKLWEATGLSYPALVNRLIGLALERKVDRNHTKHRYGMDE